MSIKLIQKLQKEIFDLTGGYIATWLPDFSPYIGDYGTIARGRLLADGNLEELEYIDINHYVGVSSMESFKYSHDVTISAEAGAEHLGAGFNVLFNSEGAFLYHFQNANIHRVENKGVFFQELAYKIMTGEIPWDDSYVIVDEVVVAERSTILISRSSGGSMSIASGTQSDAQVNFADASLNLAFKRSKGTIFDYAGHTDTRPLYHAVKPTIKPRGSVGAPSGPRPKAPTLSRLYENAKKLVGGRDIQPTEVEIKVLEEDVVEVALQVRGRVARFWISFDTVTPEIALADDVSEAEDIIKAEEFLVFEF